MSKNGCRATKHIGGVKYRDILDAARNGNLNNVKYYVRNSERNNESKKNAAEDKALLGNALILAAMYGHLSIVKYLHDKGADIHTNDDEALRESAYYGHYDIVRFLIKKGANVSANEDEAVRSAAQKEHLDIVQYLIKHGANIHARDDEALDTAVERGRLNVVSFIFNDTVDINRALYLAACYGRINIITFLLEHGADIHADNDYALASAAQNGHLDTVKFLVEHGSDINASNDVALRTAVKNEHLHIVKYLVEHGANVHANNNEVFHTLNNNSNLDIARYLSSFIAGKQVSSSQKQLNALTKIKEQAIEKDKDIQDSVLQYIGLIMHLLYQHYKSFGINMDSITGISNFRYNVITYLTNIDGYWILELPNTVNLRRLCNEILNPMLHGVLINNSVYDAALINMCKSMGVDSFQLTQAGIQVTTENNPALTIIKNGDKHRSITKYERLDNAVTQNYIYDDMSKMFKHMIISKHNKDIEDLREVIHEYIFSTVNLTAFTTAYMFQMPYINHFSVLPNCTYNTQNYLLMQAVDLWKAFLEEEHPSFADSLYSNLDKDFIEVYSGRNMLYSSSGKAISALKGKHIYLTACISTSILPSISFEFVSGKSSPVFYKFKIPKHALHQVLPISQIGCNEREAEVMLPLGTKLRVDDLYPCRFDKKDNPYLVIEATICANNVVETDIFRTAFAANAGICNTAVNKRGGGIRKPCTATSSAASLSRFHNDIGILTMSELIKIAYYVYMRPLPQRQSTSPRLEAARGNVQKSYWPPSILQHRSILQSAGKFRS